eukprot:GHUV01039370.1.p2 GENE.GHUV01039370.1~~GHUV01039370.1.p2  ORF type:complete len:102 (-),score=30.44 GHUV01039370.1:1069-1374(-)
MYGFMLLIYIVWFPNMPKSSYKQITVSTKHTSVVLLSTTVQKCKSSNSTSLAPYTGTTCMQQQQATLSHPTHATATAPAAESDLAALQVADHRNTHHSYMD